MLSHSRRLLLHGDFHQSLKGHPLLLKLTEVPLLLSDVPPSTFVSVGSALSVKDSKRQSRSKKNPGKHLIQMNCQGPQ